MEEEAGWKRSLVFLLFAGVNHVPTTAISFSNLQGCRGRAERASPDVLELGELGAGWGWPAPQEGVGSRGRGLFPPFLCCHYIFST